MRTTKGPNSTWRTPSNEEVCAKLADAEVVGLMRSVSSSYRNQLSEDDRSSMAMWALYRCIGYWREGFGKKFTTNLWMFLHNEFRRELRRQRRKRLAGDSDTEWRLVLDERSVEEADPFYDDRSERDLGRLRHVMTIAERFLPSTAVQMVKSHYLDGKTYAQIGQEHGMSEHAIARQLSLAMCRLRELCRDEDLENSLSA